MTDFYEWHSVWEADHPLDAEHARAYAQHRHQAGRPIGREFPCTGVLRHVDQVGDISTVACDACNFRTVVRVKESAHATAR